MNRSRPQISLLVPFRASRHHPHRLRVWRWLERYWRHELPDAEIVIGRSKGRVFSKTEAINDAARRARGRIFVLLDSDAYMAGEHILYCARAIEKAKRRGHRLWFVPYRNLYRLTEQASELVLKSDPLWPHRFTSPPHRDELEHSSHSHYGHHYGAMVQIMPREAFFTVGCMDPRMQGWGSEDVAFLRAVDTLWGKHKTLNVDLLHLWHPSIAQTPFNKMWEGQETPNVNGNLGQRYHMATGDIVKMRALVDEGCKGDCCRLCRFFRKVRAVFRCVRKWWLRFSHGAPNLSHHD